MIFIWIIYLLQVSFIPGILIYNYFITDKSTVESLPISFGISLILNHFFIMILSLLGIFNYKIFIVIFSIEFLIFIYLVIIKRNLFLLKSLIIQILILSLLIILNQYFTKSESFMNGEDQIFSWNAWALDWFANKFPENTRNYPQLLPTNWSLSYVILKSTELEFLAKSVMPLFFINIVLFSFSYFEKEIEKIFSVILISIFALIAWRNFPSITMGLADIPVAFFTYVTILYSVKILYAHLNTDIYSKYFILSSIFACGAALTKQAGLFCLIYISFLFIVKINEIRTSINVKKYFIFFFLIILSTLSNYIISLFKIIIGFNQFDPSELIFSNESILSGKSIYTRFFNGFEQLFHLFYNKYIFMFFLLLILYSLKKRTNKILFFSFVLPYFFIWILFYSYDTRNLSIAIPLLGYLFSQGFIMLFIKFDLSILRNKILKKSIYFLSLITTIYLLIFTSKDITKNYLINENIRRKKIYLGFNEQLNSKIYSYIGTNNLNQIKISSNYRYISKMPQIDAVNCNFLNETYFKCLEMNNVKYILLTNNRVSKKVATLVEKEIFKNVNQNKFKIVFKNENTFFIKTY